MTSLDTNVLVRWLMNDDEHQADKATSVINTGESLFVPITVLLELEWVLRHSYDIKKPKIIDTIIALLQTKELSLQFESAIERALYAFTISNADFADCLHVGLCGAESHLPILTFDRKASKLDGIERL